MGTRRYIIGMISVVGYKGGGGRSGRGRYIEQINPTNILGLYIYIKMKGAVFPFSECHYFVK